MPARTGKCINFGGCNKADSKEVMTIPDGTEFVCPECEKSLMPAGGSGKGGSGGGGGKFPLKLILAAVVGLGVIGGIVALVIGHNSPEIQTLAIEPAQIQAGQTATLKWSVDHATDVSIDPGLGPVQSEDTFPVSPRGTTTYTLTAKKGSNVVTKSVTLQVKIAQLPPAPIPGPAPVPGPAPRPVPVPAPVVGPPVITSFSHSSCRPGRANRGPAMVDPQRQECVVSRRQPSQEQSAAGWKSQYHPSFPRDLPGFAHGDGAKIRCAKPS